MPTSRDRLRRQSPPRQTLRRRPRQCCARQSARPWLLISPAALACWCWLATLTISSATAPADEAPQPRPDDAPIGWAAAGRGTTGGAGGTIHRPQNADELTRLQKLPGPKIIQIDRPIRLRDDLRVGSDVTLQGIGPEARLLGGGLHIRQARNVVVRDLTISQAGDAINIEESEQVWIDHCDLSQCKDGLIDIKRGSDYVTISWNHLHDHHKSCLLGHSDKSEIRAIDRGKLRTTYHHNWFDRTGTRHPRVRFAEGVHLFNNYFLGNEYGVAALMDSAVLVEGNLFEDVEHPTLTRYGDSPDPGRLVARDNRLIDSGALQTRGEFDPRLIPYQYRLDPPDAVADIVRQGAGPRNGN